MASPDSGMLYFPASLTFLSSWFVVGNASFGHRTRFIQLGATATGIGHIFPLGLDTGLGCGPLEGPLGWLMVE